MNAFSRWAVSATCALASSLTLSTPLQAFDISDMSTSEQAAFGNAVRNYLLENPQVILEAVDKIEQQQASAEAARDDALVAQYLSELQDDGFSWVGGNPDGDITIVEFMDYRCGYCRRAAPEITKLLEDDSNIRLVIKEFPILGEASLIASRFAVATKQVAGDDAYKAIHDALIAMRGEPNDVTLRRIANGLDLDADAIFAQMDTSDVTNTLTRTRALAQNMQISGTPSFVLDQELLRGYLPAAQMQLMIQEIRDARS